MNGKVVSFICIGVLPLNKKRYFCKVIILCLFARGTLFERYLAQRIDKVGNGSNKTQYVIYKVHFAGISSFGA
jgi:uncharacterized membrane protein YiaA